MHAVGVLPLRRAARTQVAVARRGQRLAKALSLGIKALIREQETVHSTPPAGCTQPAPPAPSRGGRPSGDAQRASLIPERLPSPKPARRSARLARQAGSLPVIAEASLTLGVRRAQDSTAFMRLRRRKLRGDSDWVTDGPRGATSPTARPWPGRIFSGFTPQGVLSGRARPSFPRVALATTRRETRRPMTSKTTAAGSDTDRQAILDVLANLYQAWSRRRRGVRGRLHRRRQCGPARCLQEGPRGDPHHDGRRVRRPAQAGRGRPTTRRTSVFLPTTRP